MILFRGLIFFPLLIFLLLINTFQVLTLILLPFSRRTFRRLNSRCGALWWFCLSWVLENISGVQVEIGGEGFSPNLSAANVLILSNHQSIVDPLIILIFAKKLGGLKYLKWFVKRSLLYVPFLGWGLWFLDCIFLKRNWSEDQKSIVQHFRTILRLKDPVWLVSFPEGTRRTEKGLLDSKKFATKQSEMPFRYVLFPRYKGFLGIIQGMGNRLEWIYDLTLVYSSPEMNWVRLFWGDFGKVQIVLERIPTVDLPLEPDLLRAWLMERFRRKDEILSEVPHFSLYNST